jgi:Cellulase (glycosyl hydrolase family 5)
LSGAEYACLQQHSIWDDPKGDAATVNAMLRWHANVVRLPLDEECWLGINGAPKRYSGKNYAHAISRFTSLANSLGLIVEVDLHFGAAGSSLPRNDRYPGLDLDHAPAFWRSVARTFKSNRSVIFNLINEPYIKSWNCYRYGGCETPPVGKLGRWKVVGTQRVVDVIRATGAGNPIVIAGLKFSNDLSRSKPPATRWWWTSLRSAIGRGRGIHLAARRDRRLSPTMPAIPRTPTGQASKHICFTSSPNGPRAHCRLRRAVARRASRPRFR